MQAALGVERDGYVAAPLFPALEPRAPEAAGGHHVHSARWHQVGRGSEPSAARTRCLHRSVAQLSWTQNLIAAPAMLRGRAERRFDPQSAKHPSSMRDARGRTDLNNRPAAPLAIPWHPLHRQRNRHVWSPPSEILRARLASLPRRRRWSHSTAQFELIVWPSPCKSWFEHRLCHEMFLPGQSAKQHWPVCDSPLICWWNGASGVGRYSQRQGHFAVHFLPNAPAHPAIVFQRRSRLA